MASTPKIRGNCQHRRDNFDNEKSETVLLQEKQELQQTESPEEEDAMPSILDSNENLITKQVRRRGSYSHGNSNTPNSNLVFHPSPQSQTQYLVHPEDEQPHNIHHTYPLNERAPSTISAISGLSNPSCFPQDHLQQPMLGGGSTGFNSHSGSSAFMNAAAIKESTSFNSANSGMSGLNGVGNSGCGGGFGNVSNNNLSSSPRGIGLSAFSSGVENENRRLREQLNAAQKKVEEKDAIISQLMKRIADLEHSHAVASISGSAPREVNSKTNGIRSYSMDQDSYAMSSLWDHSRPASDVYAPAPSFHANRSPSADAESISMSSPPLSVKTITKQSPITTLTSSTASVTTANSSKSHHQRGNSSKSLPGQQSPGSVGRMRRSPYRKGGVNNTAGGDDRRFQC